MGERAPYSRIYWTVRNDPRLAGIYGDDHHWAAWSRLLLTADMSWPAPADLPRSVRQASVDALVKAGVIELLPGGLFTFHGLDTERGRRQEAARSSVGNRWQTERSPSGTQVGTERHTSRAETSRGVDETRRDEPSIAREGLLNLTPKVGEAWELASGRTVLASGNFALEYIDDACRRHAEADIIAAIQVARLTFNGSIPTTQQLTVATRAILDPLPDSKKAAADEREVERATASEKAVLATLERLHGNGAHADDRHPRCPRCLEVIA